MSRTRFRTTRLDREHLVEHEPVGGMYRVPAYGEGPRGQRGVMWVHRRLHGWSEMLRLPGPLRRWTLPLTWTLTVAAALAGLLGGAAAWTADAAGPAMLRGLGTAMLIGGLTFVVALPAGLKSAGIVHLAYLALTVSVPLVGAAIAVRSLVGELPLAWALLGTALMVPAGVGWWATHVEPFRLQIVTVPVELSSARTGSHIVRIGVLADLQTNHIGPYEHRAIDLLMAEAPDLILVPGDLFQAMPDRFAREEEALRALLRRLDAPHGVFFVRGDTERWDYAERAICDTGIVTLDDEMVEMTVGDRRILLGGNRLDYSDPSAVALRQAMTRADAQDGTIHILVAHRPDAVLDLPASSRVDLTVAGHTHGGQVVVPRFGPLLTLTSVPRRVAQGGLHQLDGNTIYVSPGVGLERGQAPQIRLFCPPRIAVLELGTGAGRGEQPPS